jgi:glycosyltransferase involved in cell wall biosynthesis
VFHHFPVAQLRNLATALGRTRRFRPDILHTYFFWSIVFGRILRAVGAVPRLVENREDLGFSWGSWEYAVLRATARVPDRIVCVCEAVRRRVLDRERADPERTVVIHNGVDAPPSVPGPGVARRALGFASDAPVVGMVANLNRRVKGVEYFIDAIPLILAAAPSARFVVFGHGHLQPELERRTAALGVERMVRFAGFEADRDRIYPALDVSVLTSLSEGLSITILESMAYGIPVVVTDVGGNREVVADGVTGWLVPARDPTAFAARVVELLLNRAEREAMGREARTRCLERFDSALVADRYRELYRQLLNERAR